MRIVVREGRKSEKLPQLAEAQVDARVLLNYWGKKIFYLNLQSPWPAVV